MERKTSVFEKKDVKETKKRKGTTKIMPLKDFHIVYNKYDIVIKEGVEIAVPDIFLVNLKTEKIIKAR